MPPSRPQSSLKWGAGRERRKAETRGGTDFAHCRNLSSLRLFFFFLQFFFLSPIPTTHPLQGTNNSLCSALQIKIIHKWLYIYTQTATLCLNIRCKLNCFLVFNLSFCIHYNPLFMFMLHSWKAATSYGKKIIILHTKEVGWMGTN